MFPNGVTAYVDLMAEVIPDMKDGTIRTAIDTGCGVSFTDLFFYAWIYCLRRLIPTASGRELLHHKWHCFFLEVEAFDMEIIFLLDP